MGQFANNIENLWGYKEVLIAGPKDYVKYTDQFQTRSHINFDDGTITVETIAGMEPTAHLRRAIIKTLLMGDDPTSVDLYSDVDDIKFLKNPSCMVRSSTIPASLFAGKAAPRHSRITC